jgi:Listeria/Bacterioides repeat/Listeria/Bacterioides repeat
MAAEKFGRHFPKKIIDLTDLYNINHVYKEANNEKKFLIAFSVILAALSVFLFVACDKDETPVKFTVTFDTDGGSEIAPVEFDGGAAFVPPANPTKDGCAFGGWYIDKNLSALFQGAVNGNVTVHAKWIPNPYTIIFDSRGGTDVAPITGDFGATVTAPAAPTKTGHSFGGWFIDAAGTNAYTFSTIPLAGITLYAKWTLGVYNLSYEVGDAPAVTAVTYAYGANVALPTPSYAGYDFDGWYSDASRTIPLTISTMPADNVTAYAKWIHRPTLPELFAAKKDLIDKMWGSLVNTEDGDFGDYGLFAKEDIPAAGAEMFFTGADYYFIGLSGILAYQTADNSRMAAELQFMSMMIGNGAPVYTRLPHSDVYVVDSFSLYDIMSEAQINDYNGVYYSADGTRLLRHAAYDHGFVVPAAVTSIGDYAFAGNKALTDIKIHSGVTIGAGAFSYMDNLSVSLPSDLTDIPANAFDNTTLRNFSIPDSVQKIGRAAFNSAEISNEYAFTLPSSLEEIGAEAFRGAEISNYDFLVLPASVKKIGDEAFDYLYFYGVYVPAGVEEVGDAAVYANKIFYELPYEEGVFEGFEGISGTNSYEALSGTADYAFYSLSPFAGGPDGYSYSAEEIDGTLYYKATFTGGLVFAPPALQNGRPVEWKSGSDEIAFPFYSEDGVSLLASATEGVVSVTFEMNGGDPIPALFAPSGAKVSDLLNIYHLYKQGYVFSHFVDANNDIFEAIGTEDITLTAVWATPNGSSLGSAVEAGATNDVDIEFFGQYVYFRYVPDADGVYVIYSSDETGDPLGFLLDFEGRLIDYNDYGYETGSNFRITARLKSGITYYVLCKVSDYNRTGSYTLNIMSGLGDALDYYQYTYDYYFNRYYIDYVYCGGIDVPELPSEINGLPVIFYSGVKSFRLSASFDLSDYDDFGWLFDCEEIKVDPANDLYTAADGVLFSKDMTVLYAYPSKKIGGRYIVPASVVEIADYAFRNSTNLGRIELPDGLVTIGRGAFAYAGIKYIAIPASVENIGEGAFETDGFGSFLPFHSSFFGIVVFIEAAEPAAGFEEGWDENAIVVYQGDLEVQTYNLYDGETLFATKTDEVYFNLPGVYKEGYIFLGWSNSDDYFADLIAYFMKESEFIPFVFSNFYFPNEYCDAADLFAAYVSLDDLINLFSSFK